MGERARHAGLRLAVNTQTPLVRFRDPSFLERKLTTGGVTRMLDPLLQGWLKDGTASAVEWVALAGSEGAPPVDHAGLRLSFVGLDDETTANYALAKEHLWSLLNANPGDPEPAGPDAVPAEGWRGFETYQRRSALALEQAADRMGGADLVYVHDFQQLGVARWWEGRRVPSIFHLHTPFPSSTPDAWAAFLIDHLDRYDAVIVSTRRYAENLQRAGLRAPLCVVPPFVDPAPHVRVGHKATEEFRRRYHIDEGERVVLNVARMDPMKAQDRLIRAFPHVLERVPNARLVLVGNGSFSNAKRGGLGLSKGEQWRAALEALARELGVAPRVTFTGHLDDELLAPAYASCDVFALPSTREGFGLVTVEAWLHARPVVVSERAGVADLVEDGVNGYALDAGDTGLLADRISELLLDPDRAKRMGAAGLAAAGVATLEHGRRELEGIFDKVLDAKEEAAYVRA